MGVESGVLFGVVALLGWGVADFLVVIAAEKVGKYNTLLASLVVGSAALLVYSYFYPEPVNFTIELGIILLVIAILNIAGFLAFFKAVEKSQLSLVSPIGAMWGVVTIGLSIIFLNESLTALQAIGALLAIFGTGLVSTHWSELKKMKIKISRGIELAFFAALAWGIMIFLFKLATDSIGPVLSVLYTKGIAMVLMLPLLPFMKNRLKKWEKAPWSILIAIGLVDVIAYLGFNIGVQENLVAIVSPISASFPVVSVLLALIFFRDKLEKNQWVGIVVILTGIVLLATV